MRRFLTKFAGAVAFVVAANVDVEVVVGFLAAHVVVLPTAKD